MQTPRAKKDAHGRPQKKSPLPAARVLVANGELVLRLDCLRVVLAPMAEGSSWATLGLQNLAREAMKREFHSSEEFKAVVEDLLRPEAACVETAWFHVGYCNFKTWHLGLLPLDPVRTYESDGEEIQVLAVPAVPSPQRCFEAFSSLDLEFPIVMSWHCMRGGDRQLAAAEMPPNEIEVTSLPDKIFPRCRVWRGSEQEEVARKTKPTKPSRGKGTRRPRVAQNSSDGQGQGKKRQRKEDLCASEPQPPLHDLHVLEAASQGAIEPADEWEIDPLQDLDEVFDADEADDSSEEDEEEDLEEALEEQVGNWLDFLDGFEEQSADPHGRDRGPAASEAASGEHEEGSKLEPHQPAEAAAADDGAAAGSKNAMGPEPDSDSDTSSSTSGDSSSDERDQIAPHSRIATVPEDIIKLGEFGEIRYNHTSQQFRAHCSNPSHGQCRKTRTSKAGRLAGQGRPLGFLMQWLCCAAGVEDQKTHMSMNRFPLPDRSAARARFTEFHDSDLFFGFERERRPGEPEEPEQLP